MTEFGWFIETPLVRAQSRKVWYKTDERRDRDKGNPFMRGLPYLLAVALPFKTRVFPPRQVDGQETTVVFFRI